MTVRLLLGDCREVLQEVPEASVQCCVTSAPYFGLRDYGVAGQIGLEPTVEAYIAELVAVFREVRRVLRDDGVLFLNLGDSYMSSPAGNKPDKPSGFQQKSRAGQSGALVQFGGTRRAIAYDTPGLKRKDLIGVPWRVAFALQADGWWLRSDIIWAKPNPMPESVRDRPTKAHEYIFLLTKSARYFWDADAVAEPVTESTRRRASQPTLAEQIGSDRVPGKTNGSMKAVVRKQDGHGRRHAGFNGRYFGKEQALTRNIRTVWTIATQPFKGAHFATFPQALVERCVKAGSRVGDTVLDPFGGSGTTGLVSTRLGRDALLIDLNPEYTAIAERRIAHWQREAEKATDFGPLFAGVSE